MGKNESKAAHTPGPWVIERDRTISAPTPNGSDCITPTATIAEVFSGGVGIEQADANAALIAAAPDMLVALKEIMELVKIPEGRPVAIYGKAKAAIAKATGAA